LLYILFLCSITPMRTWHDFEMREYIEIFSWTKLAEVLNSQQKTRKI